MTSPSHTFDYFRLFYAGKQEREHFALMLLDSQHKVLECNVIFSGTIDGAGLPPRDCEGCFICECRWGHPGAQPSKRSADTQCRG